MKVNNPHGWSATSLSLDVQKCKSEMPSHPSLSSDNPSLLPSASTRSKSKNAFHLPNGVWDIKRGHGYVHSRASSLSSGVYGSEEDSTTVTSVDDYGIVNTHETKSGRDSRVRSADDILETKHRREGSTGLIERVVDFVNTNVKNVAKFLGQSSTTDSSVDDDMLALGIPDIWSKGKALKPPYKSETIDDVTSDLLLPEEQVLRVQRTPTCFMQTMLDLYGTESKDVEALVKQPTTIFVSDESFPQLRGKRDELFTHYVTIDLGQRTKHVQCEDPNQPPTGKVTPASNAKPNTKTGDVTTSSDNPFTSGLGKNVADAKNLFEKESSVHSVVAGKPMVAVCRLFVCDSRQAIHVARNHVVMHDIMRRFLGSATHTCIRIRRLSHKSSKVQGICLHPLIDNVSIM